jgi:hypothetical protein
MYTRGMERLTVNFQSFGEDQIMEENIILYDRCPVVLLAQYLISTAGISQEEICYSPRHPTWRCHEGGLLLGHQHQYLVDLLGCKAGKECSQRMEDSPTQLETPSSPFKL